MAWSSRVLRHRRLLEVRTQRLQKYLTTEQKVSDDALNPEP